MTELNDNIVARCPDCKRVVFVAHNIPLVMDPEMFQEIGELVRDGCTIEHLTIAAVRAADWGCTCSN